MTTRAYLIGLAISLLGFVGTFAYGYVHPVSRFLLSAGSLSYIVYSTLAFLVSCVGTTQKKKAWVFFSFGVVLLFTYIPAIGQAVEYFYMDVLYDYRRDRDLLAKIRFMHDLVGYSFMIVASLSIFRGIVLWSEDNLARRQANQISEVNKQVEK